MASTALCTELCLLCPPLPEHPNGQVDTHLGLGFMSKVSGDLTKEAAPSTPQRQGDGVSLVLGPWAAAGRASHERPRVRIMVRTTVLSTQMEGPRLEVPGVRSRPHEPPGCQRTC